MGSLPPAPLLPLSPPSLRVGAMRSTRPEKLPAVDGALNPIARWAPTVGETGKVSSRGTPVLPPPSPPAAPARLMVPTDGKWWDGDGCRYEPGLVLESSLSSRGPAQCRLSSAERAFGPHRRRLLRASTKTTRVGVMPGHEGGFRILNWFTNDTYFTRVSEDAAFRSNAAFILFLSLSFSIFLL